MKISLIHPSRGRANKAQSTLCEWMSNTHPTLVGFFESQLIEHILSIDEDDSEFKSYIKLFPSSKIVKNKTSSVVEATNKAAKIATGDILIYLSDDFSCHQNWNKSIIDIFKKIKTPALLKVDDCLQKFNVGVLTIPIMNHLLYEKLGYFWHPLYKSMFVDEDLYWTCKNNNWMILAPELKFQHEHPCNGKAVTDETYKRSAANWDSGKEVFMKRKSLNFPL